MLCFGECVWGVNPAEWARSEGVHPSTADRWFREGMLPVAAVRVNQRTVLVNLGGGEALGGGVGLYARVFSNDRRADLDRQVARLSEWAANGCVGGAGGSRGGIRR